MKIEIAIILNNVIIPATVVGLSALFLQILIAFLTIIEKNRLKKFNEIKPDDKIIAYEMDKNDFGTLVDSSNLTREQKFLLIKQMLIEKTLKQKERLKTVRIIVLIIFFCSSITAGIAYKVSGTNSKQMDEAAKIQFRIKDEKYRLGVQGISATIYDHHGDSIANTTSKKDGTVLFKFPINEGGYIELTHPFYWDTTMHYQVKNDKVLIDSIMFLRPYNKKIRLALIGEKERPINTARILINGKPDLCIFNSTLNCWETFLSNDTVFELKIHTDNYHPQNEIYRIEINDTMPRLIHLKHL